MLQKNTLPFLLTFSLCLTILTTCVSTNRLLPIPTLTLASTQPSKLITVTGEEPTEDPTPELTKTFMPLLRSGYPFNSTLGAVLEPLSNAGGMDQLAAANARWTRAELLWGQVKPSRTQPADWSKVAALESQLLEAAKNDWQVVLIIGQTPQWALKPGSCGAVSSEFFDDFASLLRETVQRYSRAPYNIKYWELYNEPDAPIMGCWGDPADTLYYGGGHYGEMLKKVYPVMKAANPEVQVMVGGLLLDCDPVNPPELVGMQGQAKDCTPARFLEGILEAGAKNSFDGVSFHSYDYGYSTGYSNPNWNSSSATTGPATLAKASYLRGLLAKYGVPEKFLINTELALLCANANMDGCTGPAYLENQAYYVAKVMAASKADGYRVALWYSSTGGRGNALFDLNTLAPLPAYHAFRVVNNEIGSVEFKSKLSLGEGLMGFEYQQKNNHLWVVWAKDTINHQISLPQMPKAIYRIGPDGVAVSVTPSTTVLVGNGPVFIEY